jgi:hypothetical protein
MVLLQYFPLLLQRVEEAVELGTNLIQHYFMVPLVDQVAAVEIQDLVVEAVVEQEHQDKEIMVVEALQTEQHIEMVVEVVELVQQEQQLMVEILNQQEEMELLPL